MLNHNILDSPNNPLPPRPRPAMLEFTCALSWLGTTIAAVVLGSRVVAMLNLYQSVSATDGDFSTALVFVWKPAASFFIALLRFASVVFIWRLRKMGFYLYLASCLLDAAMGYYLTYTGELGHASRIFYYILTGFSLLFIALYYKHIKHLQ